MYKRIIACVHALRVFKKKKTKNTYFNITLQYIHRDNLTMCTLKLKNKYWRMYAHTQYI